MSIKIREEKNEREFLDLEYFWKKIQMLDLEKFSQFQKLDLEKNQRISKVNLWKICTSIEEWTGAFSLVMKKSPLGGENPRLQGESIPLGRSPGQIFQESCRIELRIQQSYPQALRPPGRGQNPVERSGLK